MIMGNAKTVAADVKQAGKHDGCRRKSYQEGPAGNGSSFRARLILDFGRGSTFVRHADKDMVALLQEMPVNKYSDACAPRLTLDGLRVVQIGTFCSCGAAKFVSPRREAWEK